MELVVTQLTVEWTEVWINASISWVGDCVVRGDSEDGKFPDAGGGRNVRLYLIDIWQEIVS